MRRRRAFLETRPGVIITDGRREDVFATAPREVAKLDSALASVGRRLAEIDATREAERRAVAATAVAARRPIYHLVQRGETIESIASRYGVPPDSVREWNGIAGQRILAGERLLVNPGR
jgi:LysM repeat protein